MAILQQEISFKDNGYSQGIESAKSRLNQLNKEFGNSDKGLLQLNKTYRAGTKELTNLTNQWRNLNDAQKNSEFGQALQKQITAAQMRMAEFNDTIGDTRGMISALASDTVDIDIMTQSLGLLTGGISAAAGVASLFTDNQESLNKCLKYAAAAQGVLTIATALQNATQETGLLGVIKARIEHYKNATAIGVETAAKGVATTATNAWTRAQIALNVAMDANPIGGAIIAIAAIGAAIYGVIKLVESFTNAENDNAEALERQKMQAEANAQIHNELQKVYNDTISKAMEEKAKIVVLNGIIHDNSAAVRDRKTAIEELQKLVPEYHGAISTEGQLFNDNVAAITNYINKLDDAARAQAAFNALVKSYEKEFEIQSNLDAAKTAKTQFDKNTKTIANNYKKKRSKATNKSTFNSLLDEDKKVANKRQESSVNRQKDIDKGTAELTAVQTQRKGLEAILKKSNGNLKLSDTKTGGGSKTKTTPKATSKSTPKKVEETPEQKAAKEYANKLSEYNKSIQLADKQLKQGVITEQQNIDAKQSSRLNYINYLLSLDKLSDAQQEELKTIYDKWRGDKDIAEAKEKVKEAYEKHQKAVDDLSNKLAGELKSVKNILNPKANLSDSFKKGEKKDTSSQLSDSYTKLDNLGNEKEKLEELKKEALKLGKTDFVKDIDEQLNALQNKINETASTIPNLQKKLAITDGIDGIGEVAGNINGVIDGFKNLGSQLEADGNAFQQFLSIVQFAVQTFQTIGQTIEAVDTIMQMFTSTKQASAAVDASLTGQQIAQSQAKVGANIAEATTNVAVSTSESSKQAAKLPFPANIAGIATSIAMGMALLGTITTIVGSFANGGIVNSNAMVGDRNLIGVNGGEMILNKGQQANLFHLLDSGGIAGGTSGGVVKIKGSDLYIAMSNYGKTKKLTGKNIGLK